MNLTLARFFEVALAHAYQSEYENLDFVVSPTAECRSLLARYRLLFKSTDKGFLVLYELQPGAEDSGEPLQPLDEDLVFRFALKAKNPYLIQLSDLPIDEPSFYRFHTLNDHLREGVRYLNDPGNDSEFASTLDRLDLRPETFTFESTCGNNSALLEIHDAVGNLVQSESLTAISGALRAFIDLSDSGPGAYSLKIDGAIVGRFYADSLLARARVFGVVEIYLSALAAEEYRLLTDDGSPKFRRFKVQFGSRQIAWRYYVIPRYDTSLNEANLVIEDGSGRYGFPANGTASALDNGETAIVFVSTDPIPLQRLPIKNLQLKKRANGGTWVALVTDLPNPAIESIGYDSVTATMMSDIFVYV